MEFLIHDMDFNTKTNRNIGRLAFRRSPYWHAYGDYRDNDVILSHYWLDADREAHLVYVERRRQADIERLDDSS